MFHEFLGGEIFGVVVSLIAAKKGAMAVSLRAPLFYGSALPSSTGPTYLSGSERILRVTAQGTLGASVTASANASSIADAAGLSTRVRALARVKSPRAPFDACGSDFGVQYSREDHFKAEMRGFPTSHLRASSGTVEGSRGHREVSTLSRTAPPVLPPQQVQKQVAPVSYRILPFIRGASLRSSI